MGRQAKLKKIRKVNESEANLSDKSSDSDQFMQNVKKYKVMPQNAPEIPHDQPKPQV